MSGKVQIRASAASASSIDSGAPLEVTSHDGGRGDHEAVRGLEVGLVEAGPHAGGPRRARGRSRRRPACRWGRRCAGCPRRWRCWWCCASTTSTLSAASAGSGSRPSAAVETSSSSPLRVAPADVGRDVDEGRRAGLGAGEGDRAGRREHLALEQPGHVDRDVVALHLEEGRAGRCFVLGQGRQRHEGDRTHSVHPR